MFETLATIGTLGSIYLFACALSEAIDLEEQKSQARREEMRKAIYAVKRREWQKSQNRRILWTEVVGDDYYLN